MADKYLNNTGLTYYHNRIKNLFATQNELDTLSDRVDDIVAEGGEPNVIETVKVNGKALTPDANKAVNVTVPAQQDILDVADAAITDSINSDTDNSIASKSYVQQNGGKIDKIKVNGTEQTITNKEVDITVPTKTSDITNDSNFITNTVNDLTNYYLKTETYSQSEVDNLISAISTLDIKVVSALPTEDISTTTIYFVPKTTSETNNVYDEYVYANNAWEKIGDTTIDLSGYWAIADLTAITTAEIDTLFE